MPSLRPSSNGAGGLPLRRRRPRIDDEMDITPMIDIVFQLLIFFIVAGKIDTDAGVDLPPARHADTVAASRAAVITVARGSGEEVQIYLGDGQSPQTLLPAADPETQEEQIRQHLVRELTGGQPRDFVLIKAERSLKHRDVARVLAIVGSLSEDYPQLERLHVAVLEK